MSCENFNVINDTMLRFKRHMNFVATIKLPSCAQVESYPVDQQCQYVENTDACRDDVFIIDYVAFVYCRIQPQSAFQKVLVMALLIFICAYFFLCLGIIANAFFCPALEILAKLLGMNENVAGVTLLAIGNSLPEICTSFASLGKETRIIYSDVMGSAAFVQIFVLGLVITLEPVEVVPSIFFRDAAFFTVTVLYINLAMRTGNKVTFAEGCGVLVIYGFYIIVVILDQFLVKYSLKKLEQAEVGSEEDMQDYFQMIEQSGIASSRDGSRRNSLDSLNLQNVVSVGLMQSGSVPAVRGRNYKLWVQFANSFMVFNKQLWEEASIIHRMFLIARIPAWFAFKCFLPMVNNELALRGWSKLLNCAQLAFIPTFSLYALGVNASLHVLKIPIFLLPLIITVPLAIFVFLYSRTDSPPSYHAFFSILVVIGAAVFIQIFASEVVCILGVLGIEMHCSRSVLGVTLLTWGNCVGDLISSIALARYGYQKMALAACFATPLCNTCIILGAGFIYKALEYRDKYKAPVGEMGPNCFYFISISLFVYALFAPTVTNFELRRSIGIGLILTYLLFVTFALMGEMEVMHPYGSEHSFE